MLLTVDVGNTQTHLGVFSGDSLMFEWRAATDSARTADEWALLFGQFLAHADLSFSRQVTGVALCSVVPRATQELRDMTVRYFGFEALVVGPGTKSGVPILTDNPREVGADRIANAVAAHEMFPTDAVVVVDFGTAITVDAVSAKGEFLGGAIAPGMDTAVNGLVRATAQLSRVPLSAPAATIGKSTVASVQSGVVFGAASLVDGLVRRVIDELGQEPRVIATGGLAGIVVSHCETIERIVPALTLEGLRMIFELNAQER